MSLLKKINEWRTYGLTGAVGVFALNAVIGGLIGGVMLMTAIIKVFVNLIRLLTGRLE